MRCSRILASILFLLAAASAEIKIKVIDPQGAAVAGGQVQLLKAEKFVSAALNTSAEGAVVFPQTISKSDSYRVQVLAAGFAVATVDISPTAESLTIKLRLATSAATVV